MTWLSQFLQWMYSICSESLLFPGISYVQRSFGLGGVNHGGRCFSVLVVLRWPIMLFDFWWRRWCAAHFRGRVFCALCGVLLSQFLQWMYSICSESLLFPGISYVQRSFGLGGVNHGGRCFSVLVVLRWPIMLFDFWWRRWCAAHFRGRVFCALCGVLRWRGRWPRGFPGLGLHLWVYSKQFNTGT